MSRKDLLFSNAAVVSHGEDVNGEHIEGFGIGLQGGVGFLRAGVVG